MSLSEKKRVSNERYIKKAYDAITARWPRDYCASVRAAAAESGQSLAGYLRQAVDERMQRDGFTPPEATDADQPDT